MENNMCGSDSDEDADINFVFNKNKKSIKEVSTSPVQQHHQHGHSRQHQEHEQQPHVLPNAPHPSAQQQQQPPPPTKVSEDPNVSQPQNDLNQPGARKLLSEPTVEKVEPAALFQPEENLQEQQPKVVDSTGASQGGSSSGGTGNDVTKPAALPPATPEDSTSADQNIASTEPKISESATATLAEKKETAQKLLLDNHAVFKPSEMFLPSPEPSEIPSSRDIVPGIVNDLVEKVINSVVVKKPLNLTLELTKIGDNEFKTNQRLNEAQSKSILKSLR